MKRADRTVGIIGAGRLGQAMARTASVPAARRHRQQPRPRITDVGGRGARRWSVGGDSG